MKASACLLAVIGCGPSVAAHAAGAHIHGVGQLQVAIERDRITLELTVPLDDLVGFEHAPRNEKQRAAVRDMAEKLNQPQKLFVPSPDARCTPVSVQLDAPALPRALLDPRAPQAAAPAANDTQKRSTKTPASEHASLVAEITFRCERPERLNALEVKLFDPFGGVKRIDVQLATGTKQTGARLTPRSRRIGW